MNNKRAEYGRWTCRYCGQIFETKHLLWDHYHSCHSNLLGNPHNKGGKAWNKGQTKETNEILKQIGETLHEKYNSGKLTPVWLGRKHSDETKKKMSKTRLKMTYHRKCKKTLPYVRLDGTTVNLDSSYERKLAQIFDENHIEWIRPDPLKWVSSNGKIHNYFPDFYLPAYDVYLDPKNKYCFVVQKEKIDYIKKHYQNCIFLSENQLQLDIILSLIGDPARTRTGK